LLLTKALLFKILLHCILPLVAGAIVYLYFRQGGLMGYTLGNNTRMKDPGLLLQTLPDFLWAYSLASALFLFFGYTGLPFTWSAGVILVILLASEIIQLWFPGRFTFDFMDLGATVLAFLLSTLYFKQHTHEK
jgi:hypothetical protein